MNPRLLILHNAGACFSGTFEWSAHKRELLQIKANKVQDFFFFLTT